MPIGGPIDEIKERLSIVDVVSPRVGLKKAGRTFKGLCPFHNEKTPSFNVRQEPAVFHCFGCGEGGDVFKFVMLRERVSFPEAIEMLARRFGVPVPEGNHHPLLCPFGLTPQDILSMCTASQGIHMRMFKQQKGWRTRVTCDFAS